MTFAKLSFVLFTGLFVVACAEDPTTTGPQQEAGVSDAGAETAPPSSQCAKCAANEICVAAYDGTCTVLGVACLARTATCAAATCSLDCARYLCGTGSDGGVTFSCATTHCTGKTPVAGAFGCYGP